MHVNNNITAFTAWRHYNNNVTSHRASMGKLASGLRIRHAGDDPAGLSISERLRAQIRNTSSAASNVNNKINYLHTADAWLQKIHDILGRMAELSVMAHDGTKSRVDRDNLQREFQQLQAEITRITSGATATGKYNSLYLFRGGTGVPIMTGDAVRSGLTRAVATGSFQNVPTQGSAQVDVEGTGAGVSEAEWRVTYLGNAWQLSSTPPGLDDRIVPAPCDAFVNIPFIEGPQGFGIQIMAPQGGTRYNPGDQFILENQAGNPGTIRFVDSRTNIGAAHATIRPDVRDFPEPGLRAEYDTSTQRWTITGTGTGRSYGTIAAAPNQGGSIVNAAGFDITIEAPSSGCYSTGDIFFFTLSDVSDGLYLQTGPDSNQTFIEQALDLQAGNYEVIGSYGHYSYGSLNMTLLGSNGGAVLVRWGSILTPIHVRIDDQEAAQGAVDKVNTAIDFISSKRAILGAELSRMEQVLAGLRDYEVNARETESRIRDVDVALETVEYSKAQVLVNIGTAMIAQANAAPQGVLNLIHG